MDNNFESIFPEADDTDKLKKKVADLEELVAVQSERSSANVLYRELKRLTKEFYVGDGSDGDAVLDGSNTFGWASKSGSVYTLTQDVQLNKVTVEDGVTLLGRQYVLYIKGALVNQGTIIANGGWW